MTGRGHGQLTPLGARGAEHDAEGGGAEAAGAHPRLCKLGLQVAPRRLRCIVEKCAASQPPAGLAVCVACAWS